MHMVATDHDQKQGDHEQQIGGFDGVGSLGAGNEGRGRYWRQYTTMVFQEYESSASIAESGLGRDPFSSKDFYRYRSPTRHCIGQLLF